MSTVANSPSPKTSAPAISPGVVPGVVGQEVSAPPTTPASSSAAMTISLTPPPEIRVPLYENVAVWVAAVTLLGVYLNLRAAARRTKMELDASEKRLHVGLSHAAEQATIEREQTREQATLDRQHAAEEAHRERIATARRTVYLEAIGELVKAQSFLGSLAKQDLSKLDLAASLNGLLTAAAKINILGEMATVSKTRELVTMINKLIFTGLGKVTPLQKVKASIAVHEKLYAATQTEISRILAAMTHHNETLKNDAPGFQALQRSFDIQRAEADRQTKGLLEDQAASVAGAKAYALWVLDEVRVLANCVDELATAVRAELGLEADLGKFQEMTEAMYGQVMQTLKDVMAGADGSSKTRES